MSDLTYSTTSCTKLKTKKFFGFRIQKLEKLLFWNPDIKSLAVLQKIFSADGGFYDTDECSTYKSCRISKVTVCFSRLFLYLSQVKLC